MGVWIRHLVAHLTLSDGREPISRLVARAEKGEGIGKVRERHLGLRRVRPPETTT